MLTNESYLVAMLCYCGAGLVSLFLIYRFWLVRLPGAYRRLLMGLLFALLLTPVTPNPEANSLAPALIVALFNAAFLEGWSSARHAVWVLFASSAIGVATKNAMPQREHASNHPSSGVKPENFQLTQDRDIS